MDHSKVVFLDTETTGLDPERHQIWDLAFIRDGVEYQYRLPVALDRADPMALAIGHWWDRLIPIESVNDPFKVAEEVTQLLAGRHIVGAVPSFDDAFLKRFLREHGQAPSWNYHLIDVGNLAAGKLGISTPLNCTKLSEKLGVAVPSPEDRHTAIGDARWVKCMYEAVFPE